MQLHEILDTCSYVSKNSKQVKIDMDRIKLFASNLKANNAHWLESSPFGLFDFPTKTIVDFLIIYHAIGFCYWGNPKWSIKDTDNNLIDGSMAMIYVFVNKLKQDSDFIDFDKFKQWDYERFKVFLNGTCELSLLEKRYINFISTSKIISEKFNNDFYSYVKNITNDEILFEIIVKNFPAYQDTSIYNKKEILYFKRAQLLVSDILHVLNLKEQIKVDYSHIVGCADYKIPQILRDEGILVYCNELKNKIDEKQEIPKDSTEENEIRANTIVAVNEIKKLKQNVSNIEVNDMIWLSSQNKKVIKPYHLTKTTAY